MKKIIKEILPPVVFKIYKFYYEYFGRKRLAKHNLHKYGWFGSYKSWNEAMQDCDNKGFASEIILQKVKRSLLKVKKGEAVYERDSCLFDKIQYSWPLVAGLLWIANRGGNKLHLLDFGGSLGSSFYQNKEFLSHLEEITWNIVEQKHFVKCGKQYFQDEILKFYNDIDPCLKDNKNVNTILLSGVVQYLKDPYEFFKKLLSYRFTYIIFDRTLVFQNTETKDRLTVQKAPPEIYEASFPCWFFGENKFVHFFCDKYRLVADFIARGGSAINLGDTQAADKGYIFEIRRLNSYPKTD